MIHAGDIMIHAGGYHDARGGIMSTVGLFSTVRGAGESSLSSLQWITWAPYGASYMYGNYHLNNYRHSSKSIGIMWDFVWDTFKRSFWAASSIVTAADLSGIIWDPLVQVPVFGQLPHCLHYSRPCGYLVELHMRPAWTSAWGSFHTIVSHPSGIMRLHMGPT